MPNQQNPTGVLGEVPNMTAERDRMTTTPKVVDLKLQKKAVYETPRIVARQIIESVAAACDPASAGKAAGGPGCTLVAS